MRTLGSAVLGAFSATLSLLGADPPAAASPEPVKLAWAVPPAARPVRLLASIGSAADLKPSAASPFRLEKPFGVAIDGSGRILLADPAQKGILVIDRGAGTAALWTGNAAFPLAGPVAVAAARDGRIFAVDGYQSQVVVFDPSGAPVASFGKSALKRPEGIAIDSAAGRIYVGDVRLHQVLAFDLHTFAPASPIGEPPAPVGSAPGTLFSPARIAVNSRGQLIVADFGHCRIQMFAPDGAFLRKFDAQCVHRGALGRPYSIAVDSDDRIYLADADDNSLQIFEPDGKPLQFIPRLSPPGGGPILRTAIALDPDARIYVADQVSGRGRLQIFTQSREPRHSAAAPPVDKGPR